MKNDKPNKQEILDCLSNSGYLMESRLVKSLIEADYFVEPNQTIFDKNTGKSREIDILTEGPRNIGYEDLNVRSFFVIEAINNLYPIVLTTLSEYNQNGHIELANQHCSFLSDEADRRIYPAERLESDELQTYCQYCAITKKKGKNELMASHPEDLYNSISKMVQYCEQEINGWRERRLKPECWKVLFWRPILVFQNDILIVSQSNASKVELLDVDSARLQFNFHSNGEQIHMIIDLVKEKNLLDHLNMIADKDEILLNKLVSIRNEINA